MTEIVTATHELVSRLYGHAPQKSTRAWVVLRDGEPIGLAGFHASEDGMTLFGHLTDDLRKDRRAMVKLAGHVASSVRGRHVTVRATADESIPAAERFLKRYGFRHVAGNVFEYRGRV